MCTLCVFIGFEAISLMVSISSFSGVSVCVFAACLCVCVCCVCVCVCVVWCGVYDVCVCGVYDTCVCTVLGVRPGGVICSAQASSNQLCPNAPLPVASAQVRTAAHHSATPRQRHPSATPRHPTPPLP